MDKDRHLIHDNTFDVYERASYGHGCEIQPITDDKHKKRKTIKESGFNRFVTNSKRPIFTKIVFNVFSMLFGLRFTGQIALIGYKEGCLCSDRT